MKNEKHIWVTAEGKALYLHEMTEQHLFNAINLLEEWASPDRKLNALYGMLDLVHGEMATEHVESLIHYYETGGDGMYEDDDEQLPDIYFEMKKELKRKEKELIEEFDVL